MRIGLILAVLATIALPGAAVGAGDLQVAQELLARAGDGEWIEFPEPMKLDRIAYSGYSEYRLSNDYVLVVIEEIRRSKVLLFEVKGGRLIQKLNTDEIRTISLADLDADGRPEVLWDQVEGWGTGVLTRNFHLYKVEATGLRELWKGASWTYDDRESLQSAVALRVPDSASFTVFTVKREGSRIEAISECLTLKDDRVAGCPAPD